MSTKGWMFWYSGKRSAFIMGLGLLMLVALQNLFSGQLQKFRKASGFFLQTQWENVHHLAGGNELVIFLLCNVIVPFFAFWVTNGIMIVIDATGKPNFITRYRIQLGKNVPVDRQRLYSAFKTALFNMNFISTSMMILMIPIMKWRGDPCNLQLPTLERGFFEFIIFVIVEEILFYYSHRLFHHPLLYKRFHKKHHEWTSPISISCVYVHPVEHVLSNMLPLLVGPVLLGSHITTLMVWLTMAIQGTILSHCGYHFPFLPSTEFHDFHHLRFNQNFGMLGVLDQLHGTDSLFKLTKAYERHCILLGLTPLSESIPDSPKKLE